MDTPIALVRACWEMLPRLEAEESVLASTRTAVGSGNVSSYDAHTITRDWHRTANPTRARAVKLSDPAALAELGIGVQGVARG